MKRTLIQHIANVLENRKNAVKDGNSMRIHAAEDHLDSLARLLPSGSGIDSGTKIVGFNSRDNTITLQFAFHHMDQNGYYCGWTDYTVKVRPGFEGISISVRGQNKNDILEMLHNTFEYALNSMVESTYHADGAYFTYAHINKSLAM